MDHHLCHDNERTKSHIEKHGLSVVIIEATDYLPSFAYSVGLWQEYRHPEIICFGLSNDSLHNLVNYAGQLVREGTEFRAGEPSGEVLEVGSAMFVEVDERNVGDYFGYAMEFYNYQRFPALQMIWADRAGKFPWENGFDEKYLAMQPLLDRNADFKFREATNLGVFTTRQWLELGSPILRVVHDDDGDWQFLTGDQDPEDIRLVALSEIIKRDPSLNELFNLGYGEAAERESIEKRWVREKPSNEEDGEY
ncbi:hypothetical protein J2Y45_002291 [Dyadobacter sp. BE34]|uniref:DUF4262 domain-containing protein n=1 Tax=Dyadobacter fermentans TaxID=94254 RepID=A0ABU1QXF8_9BACT|nr:MULTISPECIES: DUF4262 domain-containing protein [Dyadobacter]MDR6805400.1 hypothetical protein [Dyadobacter fermentans]MDR7042840.1 hypothetical protein [Dyadobacter sp. BE242]MDR7197152.1 hypothetical protein [Dyadobacter sp. BE34]MDR7215413.1 hypothetical protein [Dyadobacter sp. BE31]MDR7262949.1 hypothetical protein [Dyadobacter sp. BE32]